MLRFSIEELIGVFIPMSLGYDQRLAVCVAEDRKSCEPALCILLTSLCLFDSDIAMTVFYSEADRFFLDWARNLDSERIAVRVAPLPGAYGWNVKPHALLQLLKEGHPAVVWIDSDIITTKSIAATFFSLNHNTLLVTEEALWGAPDDTNAHRARLWGFPIKRSFPFALNTAVMRVTQEHIPLLEKWKRLLEDSDYKRAQAQPWNRRPLHMIGDQDVLTALLCSDEFSDIPVTILRRGSGIIQYFGLYGYTLAERAICLVHGMPVFIHSQGVKPWLVGGGTRSTNLRRWIEAVYLDLSPYTLAASGLALADATSWTRSRSAVGALLRKLGLGYAPLVGLPIAAASDLARLVKKSIRYLGIHPR